MMKGYGILFFYSSGKKGKLEAFYPGKARRENKRGGMTGFFGCRKSEVWARI